MKFAPRLSGLRRGLRKHWGSRYEVAITECRSQVGSGALPVDSLPSFGLRINAADASDEAIRQLATSMRRLPVPVIGRINKGAYFLDLRCLDREDDFIAQLDGLN